MAGGYDFKETERSVRELWDEREIYAKAKELSSAQKERFYFLDGPPYTSGKVHIGTAWNKSLKDAMLRYKRMRGFNVWDRAGYDMHGLPTEGATEKELGISGRAAIEKFGTDKFIAACKELCVRNLRDMSETFKSFGVWMDFDDAYQTISKEWIEAEWWLIKKAHENGRLYLGERAMTWDPHAATALAKHELTYKEVEDTAIYVKFRTQGDEYLVIWTTTPWTIPFNLAVMANPDITYAKVSVEWKGEKQTWILAEDLIEDFLTKKLKLEHSVLATFSGSELEGLAYTHPLDVPRFTSLKEEMPKVHTVLMSKEYVDTSAGTGLVHCAPGCGPEDYEVGYRNGIKPFNLVDEHGYVRGIPACEGWRAKEEDAKFIALIDEKGALLHQHGYVHEYPFGERSGKPVVFRTTKQWFLKVEDLKEKMIAENDKIHWEPKAAYNAFNSWLENLRDNSISRQRYWGTPLPVWQNPDDPDDFLVVGSATELKELANLSAEPDDLHGPVVDPIQIEKDGKTYHRVPDVLDVWVDAGVASWACLHYPSRKDLFEEWFPAAFILEGKDQIRGWFNLLHVASMVALGKPAFQSVYMHGFVNDAQGRKMSKSIGNYILPEEVTGKYGVDAVRYYMIGAANPGYDMNYNFEDLEVKFRNLIVYWNMHKLLLEIAANNGLSPNPIEKDKLAQEDRYILSRLQSAIEATTKAYDEIKLNETPRAAEEFLLEVSRTYIQLVRDKAAQGSDEEKQSVIDVLFTCLTEGLTLLTPIIPFFTEHIYQQFRAIWPQRCEEESIHLRSWPSIDAALHDDALEASFGLAKEAITAILAARDKAQIGVRWPLGRVVLDVADEVRETLAPMEELILSQTNIKRIEYGDVPLTCSYELDYGALGREFGTQTGDIITMLKGKDEQIRAMLDAGKDEAEVEDVTIKESHLKVTRTAQEPFVRGESDAIVLYIDASQTPDLEAEGFAREIARSVQALRKKAGLVKSDRISLRIDAGDLALEAHKEAMAEKTGASTLEFGSVGECGHKEERTIKGKKIVFGFDLT